MSGHGHVVPNVDGLKARCGGPAICSVCAKELHAFKDSEIERLRARVAELEAAQTWQPIDTAPKDGTEIVVFAPGNRDGFPEPLPDIVSLCAWHGDAGFCVDELRQPTHWMPLPAPPKEVT